MKLMRLAPESVRLRRIARAWAAGEFSQSEYRRARAQVIDRFAEQDPDGDDTQPRWQPSEGLTPATSQGLPAHSALAGRRAPLWLALLLLVLGLGGAMLAWSEDRIPPVRDRDPNPASSPRLDVQRVVVGNFEALRGVTADALNRRIADKLLELRARHAPAAHGFSDDELDEVGRFLDALGIHEPDTRFNPADLRDLAALVARQKQRRGLSVVELEELAAHVQQIYRDAGYLLAVAYVPSQTVSDGQVELAVLPGVLGAVTVEGGDADLVRRRFADLIGRPVRTETLAARLYALNRLPGLTAQASFEEGAAVGETRLDLSLIEERTGSLKLRADNHGDAQTGQQRLAAAASWLSPRGIGDSLTAEAVWSAAPSNQLFGQLDYQTPLAGATELRAGIARNDYRWQQVEDVDAEGWFGGLALRQHLQRSRRRSAALEIGVGRQRLDWQGSLRQDVDLIRAAALGERLWDGLRIAAEGVVELAWGRIDGDRFSGQDEDFWNLSAQGSVWTPLSLPLLPGPQTLSLGFDAQTADGRLPGPRRLALGGAEAARAFQRDVYLADRGVQLDLTLRLPAGPGELLLFTDTAFGEDRTDGAQSWAHLSSAGIGWEARLGDVWFTRTTLALPVSARGSGGLDDDGPRLFWSLEYAH